MPVDHHEPSQRIIRVCRRLPVDSTPIWLMRQAGRYMAEYRSLRQRYSMLELCQTPELAAQVTMQPISRFDLDAAIIFADILLPLPALGVEFHFAKGEGPVVEKPLREPRDVALLRGEDAEERLSFVYQAIKIVREQLNPQLALIGFAGAPFTVASYMIEGGHSRHFIKTKQFMYEQQQAWHQLMSCLCEVTVRYLLRQVEAGADMLQLFDSWVGCLAREDYREYVLPYSAQIMRQIKTAGVPVVYFGTGTASLLDLMLDAGPDVLGVDWRVNLADVWESVREDAVLQGNLDPVALLAPPAILSDKVEEIMTQARGRPHIFNLGHGILPETPLENVDLVVRKVRDWSAGA